MKWGKLNFVTALDFGLFHCLCHARKQLKVRHNRRAFIAFSVLAAPAAMVALTRGCLESVAAWVSTVTLFGGTVAGLGVGCGWESDTNAGVVNLKLQSHGASSDYYVGALCAACRSIIPCCCVHAKGQSQETSGNCTATTIGLKVSHTSSHGKRRRHSFTAFRENM